MNVTFLAFDFFNIFFGKSGFDFLLEIVFRTTVMYLYCIFMLRIFGKRGMGQISNLELAIIIAFGSAVGDPMIYDDVPLLYGMVAITTIVIIQVILEKYINNNRKLERFMEGKPKLVVDSGKIVMTNAHKEVLSKEDVFRMLREKDVEHLGQVDKAFFETSGKMSVKLFHPPHKRPGLSIIPIGHKNKDDLISGDRKIPEAGLYACHECGMLHTYAKGDPVLSCSECEKDIWEKAIE